MADNVKLFQIIVRDSSNVYVDVEDFKLEVRAMVTEFGLPADIVDVIDITSGAGVRGHSPTGRLSPSSVIEFDSGEMPEFHDVAGANVP